MRRYSQANSPSVSNAAAARRLSGSSRSWRAVSAVVILVGLSAGFGLGRSSLFPQVGPHRRAGADWQYQLPQLGDEVAEEYREVFDQTRGTVAEVMQRYPASASAVASLAVLHYLAHDPKGEQRCWERCIDLAPAHSLAYARLVALAQQDSDYERVVQLMHRGLTERPRCGEFQEILASALNQLGRSDEAREVLEASLRTSPGTAGGYLVLGRAYEQLKQLEKSRRCLEAAVALAPRRVDALFSLMTVCAKLGEDEKAAEYRALFEILKKSQLEHEAKASSREQIQDQQILPPRVAEILRLAAEACIDNNDAVLAEQCLLQAATAAPQDTASRRMLSNLYDALGRWDESLATVRELRRIEPQNPEHGKVEGTLCVRLNRLDEAERVFQELCRQVPQAGVGYAGLAELYLRTGGKQAEALALAEKAARLDPTAWNFVVLGAWLERTGNMAGAKRALEQAIALDPGNPKYRQIYESLNRR